MSRKLGAFDPASTAGTSIISFSTTDSFTRLVLNFNNSAADAGPNGVTVSTGGGQYTSTAKFGTHSLDGDVNFPVGTFDIDSSLWTLECFLYQTGRSSNNGQAQSVVSSWGGSDSERRYRIHCDNGYVGLSASPDGFNFYGNIVDSGQIPLNTWQHCAWQRNGTVINIFRNGSIVATGSAGAINPVNAHVVGKSNNGNFNFNGYIDDLRILHGINLYTSSYTVPTSELTKDIVATSSVVDTRSHSHVWNYPDIYKARRADSWPDLVYDTQIALYLPFNGSLTDFSSYGHTVSAVGDAAVTTSPFQLHASCAFDGNGDLLTVPHNNIFDFGGNDFTIEGFINPTTAAGVQGVYSQWGGTGSRSFKVVISTNAKLEINGSKDGSTGTQVNQIASTGLELNTFSHFAVTREGSNFRIFINGVNRGTTTDSGALYNSSANIAIGGNRADQTTNTLHGNLEDFRVINGLALYTTAFEVPTRSINNTLTVNP